MANHKLHSTCIMEIDPDLNRFGTDKNFVFLSFCRDMKNLLTGLITEILCLFIKYWRVINLNHNTAMTSHIDDKTQQIWSCMTNFMTNTINTITEVLYDVNKFITVS